MNTDIEKKFLEFLERGGVDPKAAPQVQVDSMRLAFYGGLALAIMEFTAIGKIESEKEAVNYLENLNNDILRFFKKLRPKQSKD